MSRRSSLWVILGLSWVAMGWHVFFEPEVSRAWLVHTIPDVVFRAGLWWATGAVAAALAAFSGRAMPAWADRAAVFALTIPPVTRLVSYGIDVAMAFVPPNPPGEWWVAGDFFLWLGLVMALWSVARWPDDRTEERPNARRVG